MNGGVIGKTGLGMAVAAFAAMALTAFLAAPGSALSESPGICLPSPSAWLLRPWLSRALNLLLLLACALAISVLNRRYTFVQGTDPLMPAALLVLMASCPWDVQRLCTGAIMLAVNIACLHLLFSCRESANNTYRLFTAASLLAAGVAIQPAFLPFAVFCPVGAMILKAMRFREAAAYAMGLISPFVALLGLGIVSPADFRFDLYPGLPDISAPASDLFMIAAGVAFTMLWALIVGARNTMQLLKANAEIRHRNAVVSLMGLVAGAGCIFNFPNLIAYVPTLYLAAATQLANSYSLSPRRSGPLLPLLLMIGYIIYFLFCSSIL